MKEVLPFPLECVPKYCLASKKGLLNSSAVSKAIASTKSKIASNPAAKQTIDREYLVQRQKIFLEGSTTTLARTSESVRSKSCMLCGKELLATIIQPRMGAAFVVQYPLSDERTCSRKNDVCESLGCKVYVLHVDERKINLLQKTTKSRPVRGSIIPNCAWWSNMNIKTKTESRKYNVVIRNRWKNANRK